LRESRTMGSVGAKASNGLAQLIHAESRKHTNTAR
jgi:hypothetical protein